MTGIVRHVIDDRSRNVVIACNVKMVAQVKGTEAEALAARCACRGTLGGPGESGAEVAGNPLCMCLSVAEAP